MTTSWRLPVPGRVVDLVAAYSDACPKASVDEVGREFHWVSGSGSGRKRTRLNRKNSCTPRWVLIHSRPRVWKRLSHVDLSDVSGS